MSISWCVLVCAGVWRHVCAYMCAPMHMCGYTCVWCVCVRRKYFSTLRTVNTSKFSVNIYKHIRNWTQKYIHNISTTIRDSITCKSIVHTQIYTHTHMTICWPAGVGGGSDFTCTPCTDMCLLTYAYGYICIHINTGGQSGYCARRAGDREALCSPPVLRGSQDQHGNDAGIHICIYIHTCMYIYI